jgi:hypothetical protein
MPPSSHLRCAILAYSIGDQTTDSWKVDGKATRRFGDAARWELLDGQPLWRVNGRKEQPNPMPLGSLKLKADCRFHVRNPANRDGVREDYEALTTELAGKGFYHLGYGVVTIDVPARDVAASAA